MASRFDEDVDDDDDVAMARQGASEGGRRPVLETDGATLRQRQRGEAGRGVSRHDAGAPPNGATGVGEQPSQISPLGRASARKKIFSRLPLRRPLTVHALSTVPDPIPRRHGDSTVTAMDKRSASHPRTPRFLLLPSRPAAARPRLRGRNLATLRLTNAQPANPRRRRVQDRDAQLQNAREPGGRE